MPKAPLEIRRAKEALEQRISDILFEAIMLWQKKHGDWLITDADLGIIDISEKQEQKRMPATAVVEITKKDLTLKITKWGKVKEMK
jgi:hypothetical protein